MLKWWVTWVRWCFGSGRATAHGRLPHGDLSLDYYMLGTFSGKEKSADGVLEVR